MKLPIGSININPFSPLIDIQEAQYVRSLLVRVDIARVILVQVNLLILNFRMRKTDSKYEYLPL